LTVDEVSSGLRAVMEQSPVDAAIAIAPDGHMELTEETPRCDKDDH